MTLDEIFASNPKCDDNVLTEAVEAANPRHLFCEFGVFRGASLRRIAAATKKNVYGFDSFKGLPEDWRPGFPAGTFACERPTADMPENAKIIEGKIEDRLPWFLRAKQGSYIGFLHIDVDVYSTASFVLRTVAKRVKPGCIILLDEVFDGGEVGGTWNAENEGKAFREFLSSTGFGVELIGRRHPEAFAFRLTQPKRS